MAFNCPKLNGIVILLGVLPSLNMPVSHFELCIPPASDAVLWRYMELDRFRTFLDRKALFFSRADKFADPFEGSLPKLEYEHRPRMHREIDLFYGNQPDDNKIAEAIADMSYRHLEFKRTHIINCWHSNPNESDAMWRLYLKSNEGVAIQTTTARLIESFQNNPLDIDISSVRYLDYETEGFYNYDYPHTNYNLFMPLVHKRNEFSHEREVRLIHEVREAEKDINFWDSQELSQGKLLDVDVNILVNKIILPPTSDEKVRQEVDFLVRSRDYAFELEKSILSRQAYF